MSAGDAERRTAHQHARAGDIAGVDGVTQGHVAVSFCSDIAHGGEAGLQRDARIARASQSRARNRNRETLRSDILRIAGQVGVRVGQARQNRGVRQIDQAVTGRAVGLGERTDADDLATLDHDGLVGESLAAADIEQLSGVNNDSAGGLGGRLLRSRENA